MDSKQIVSAIIQGRWTITEIDTMINAIKFARTWMAKETIRSISQGSTVEFDNTKTGGVMRGSVKKIAQKYVTVDTGRGLWRVPASVLRLVEA